MQAIAVNSLGWTVLSTLSFTPVCCFSSPVHLARARTRATAALRPPCCPCLRRGLCRRPEPTMAGMLAPSLSFPLCKIEHPNPNLSYLAICIRIWSNLSYLGICIRIWSNYKCIHVLRLLTSIFFLSGVHVYTHVFCWVRPWLKSGVITNGIPTWVILRVILYKIIYDQTWNLL